VIGQVAILLSPSSTFMLSDRHFDFKVVVGLCDMRHMTLPLQPTFAIAFYTFVSLSLSLSLSLPRLFPLATNCVYKRIELFLSQST
jgi:hypothetical protein